MIESNKLNDLLRGTKRIIKHQREIEKLKGENFNIFSILKMESKENETHSAFLGELLNPKGSHLKGSVFLKLFLDVIEDNSLEISTTKVKLEHHIGTRNDQEKSGGRIDIYFWDKNGNSLSIENKIYAGDQNVQIERYYYHNNKTNKVFYLTLFGNEASKESSGKLIANKDYFTISYKEHIQKWLQLCIKESANEPILRETVKQYVVLIKKLTLSMDTEKEKELIKLMFEHFEESTIISNNFISAKNDLAEKVRQHVITKLQEKISENYIIEPGHDSSKKYSQIWIKIKEKEKSDLYFGIESFNDCSNQDRELRLGVMNDSPKRSNYADIERTTEQSRWWMNVSIVKDYEGYKVSLGNAKTIQKLYSDNIFFEGFVEHIVIEIEDYLSIETKHLLDFLNRN